MVVFKRNKRYRSLLVKTEGPKYNGNGKWVNDVPLFKGKLNGKEVGLFPVFNVRGPHGRFPMNHQEYIVKELGHKNETFGI